MEKTKFDVSSLAMLVSLNIGVWDARKISKRATEEVASLHNADAIRIGRFNKCLIDVKDPAFKAIGTCANESRAFHYKLTQPWLTDGTQILSMALYMDWTNELRRRRSTYFALVDDFVDNAYPRLKAAAKRELNGLYEEKDYPSAAELRKRYTFEIQRFPMPSTYDFRISLSEEAVADLQASLQEDLQKATHQVVKDLWARLNDVISKLADKLVVPDAIFRDSLIGNAKELLGLLPKLNFTNDPDIAWVGESTAKMLAGVEAQALREDTKLRADVAAQAVNIQAAMSAFM